MAGDWIKMRPSLLTSPKVNGIARALEQSQRASNALSTGYTGPMSEIVTRNVMRNVTVASLLTVWGAANEHTTDGVFANADLSDIDDMVGIPGFGSAMASVGWAEYDEENFCVILPNFSEYNTCGKDRTAEQNAERQRRYREKQKEKSNVTQDVTNNAREEKRREEKKEEEKIKEKTSAAPKYSPLDDLIAQGVDSQIAVDWIAVRKAKKAASTKTAIDAVLAKISEAGMTADAGLRVCCERGWAGFNRDWLPNVPARASPSGPQQLGKAGQATAAAAQRLLERMANGQAD